MAVFSTGAQARSRARPKPACTHLASKFKEKESLWWRLTEAFPIGRKDLYEIGPPGFEPGTKGL